MNLGATGLKVSRICLGCMSYGDPTWQAWTLDEESSRPFFRQAVEAGINFFDTANAYAFGRSEQILGSALKDLGVRRDEAVVATKVFFPTGDTFNEGGLSRAVKRGLRRCKTTTVSPIARKSAR